MDSICVMNHRLSYGVSILWFHTEESAFEWACYWAEIWDDGVITVVIN